MSRLKYFIVDLHREAILLGFKTTFLIKMIKTTQALDLVMNSGPHSTSPSLYLSVVSMSTFKSMKKMKTDF